MRISAEDERLLDHATDAAALARFEALMLSQQPATQPWTPVTDYSFEARKAIEGIHPQLIKDVFQPQKIYDAGCGAEAIFIRILEEAHTASDHVCGFDIAIPDGQHPHRNAFHGDLTTWPVETHYERHDLVICREVLEHLTIRQIQRAVVNLCAISSKWVYVTTRFAKNPTHLLDVDTSDDLDPTHITMLNQDFLRVLFVLQGFKRRADLEQRMDWQKKGRCLVYERV